ncbi:MAG: tRNA1(Val) (adenine(37)-N6)-methyltransferase [Mycoplasmatales bacterium]
MRVIHNLTKDEKLKIIQETELNNFTFDSLLLADFAKVNRNTKYVCDLCTGNAPIPLLLKYRAKQNFVIDCVEIQPVLAKLAVESIELNKYQTDIFVHEQNLINVSDVLGKNKYQLVTCNPPYFKVDENSNINPNESIAMARHEISVTLEQIIEEARKLLTNTGVVAFVFRPERFDELIYLLKKNQFSVTKIKFVYPKKGKKANTVLVEAKRKNTNSHVMILEPLYVYNADGTYTADALKIINRNED